MNPAYLNFLSSLKNASLAGNKTVSLPVSKFSLSLAKTLKDNHYIGDFSQKDNQIIITEPRVKQITFFSTPGRRFYQKASKLPWGTDKNSLIIISTSVGLMSQRQAQKQQIGGEIIVEIN